MDKVSKSFQNFLQLSEKERACLVGIVMKHDTTLNLAHINLFSVPIKLHENCVDYIGLRYTLLDFVVSIEPDYKVFVIVSVKGIDDSNFRAYFDEDCNVSILKLKECILNWLTSQSFENIDLQELKEYCYKLKASEISWN